MAIVDVRAVLARLEGFGRDRVLREVRALLEASLPFGEVDAHGQLVAQASDRPPGWLERRVLALPRAERGAFYRHHADALGWVDEPDATLATGLLVLRVLDGVGPGDPAFVRAALAAPDPRVRALLALRYRGEGLEEDEDGGPLVAEWDAVWDALVEDPEDLVRAAVLWNPRAPRHPPVDDPSALVRAHHPDTSPAERAALAHHDDLDVLAGVAANGPECLAPISRRLGIPPVVGAWPNELLTGVDWCFGPERFATRAAFVAALEARRPGGVEWRAPAPVVRGRALELRFFAVVGTALDSATVRVETERASGFDAVELLWRTHEALAGFALGPRVFFEGFRVVASGEGDDLPILQVLQGS
jgi:hypothetical protein